MKLVSFPSASERGRETWIDPQAVIAVEPTLDGSRVVLAGGSEMALAEREDVVVALIARALEAP